MNLVCLQKFHLRLKSKRKALHSKAKQRAAEQRQGMAELRLSVPGRGLNACNLHEVSTPTRPIFLIQNISDTQQVFRRPEMDIDFFCCPGIGVAKDNADELNGDVFYIQGRGEIMPQSLRTKSRYPGVPGKFFTKVV